MFKRVLLALTFVAALGAAGLGTSNKAQAHGGCGYGGYGGYGYRDYYPSYYADYGYAPRFTYYRGYPGYHRSYYGGHGHHHGHHRGGSGVHFSIGF